MKVKINESQLHSLIMESIKKVLNEGNSYCRDYGRFEFCPDDYCSEEEAEILDQAGVKFSYEIKCSRDGAHTSGSYDQPPYDDYSDITIEDDGGLYHDLEPLRYYDTEIYEKIIDGINAKMEENPDSFVDWYASDADIYDMSDERRK